MTIQLQSNVMAAARSIDGEAMASTANAATSLDSASAVAEEPSAADEDDDLFGDDDDDGDDVGAHEAPTSPSVGKATESGDDDEEENIRPSNRRSKRALSTASPAAAASPSDQRPAAPGLLAFKDNEDNAERKISERADEVARIAALEYAEDSQPMGRPEGRSLSPQAFKVVANIALANTVQRFTPYHLARLPLFLKIDSKEFKTDDFIKERQAAALAEEQLDERIRDVERRLRCENTIRWRTDDKGLRQSNSRFVRWSDGSWTLQVGKEHFDVAGLDTRFVGSKDLQVERSASNVVAASQQSGGGGSFESQLQDQTNASQGVRAGGSGAARNGKSSGPGKGNQQPLTYLATPHEDAGLFQTLGPLHSNISIQPTSLQSATHRLISQNFSSIRAREGASKVTMSELVAGEKAPEELKRERERKLLDEERKKRLRKRREAGGDIEAEEEAELLGLLKGRRKTMIEEASKSSRARGAGGSRRGGGGLSTAFDEEEEEEDVDGYIEDDADGFIVNDEDEDIESEDGNDDDEERGSVGRRLRLSKKRSSTAARFRPDAMNIEDEPDDMERADMEIERQKVARAKAKKETAVEAVTASSGGQDGADPD